MKSSDNTCSTGEGNGNPLQCSCLKNPMNSMKRQKNMTLEDELARLVGTEYATGEKWKSAPERMKQLGQGRNDAQLWKVKSYAVKNNTA